MAQVPNAPNNNGPRRRSQRVLMQVAVRIRGLDAQGQKFEEETETLAINAHGALVLLTARLTSGSKVELQHKKTLEEQECHVVFLGPVRSGKAEISPLQHIDRARMDGAAMGRKSRRAASGLGVPAGNAGRSADG